MAGQGQTETARPEDQVRTASRPSELRITDMRTATVGWDNWHFTIVRIDTNQGISGYGEVRDFASKNYALMLKSRSARREPLQPRQALPQDQAVRRITGGRAAASAASRWR